MTNLSLQEQIETLSRELHMAHSRMEKLECQLEDKNRQEQQQQQQPIITMIPDAATSKSSLASSLFYRVFCLVTCSSLTMPDNKSFEDDEEELHY
jgi:hypothetical protein